MFGLVAFETHGKGLSDFLLSSFALLLLNKTLQNSLAAYDEIQTAWGLAVTEMPVDIRWELTDLLKPC